MTTITIFTIADRAIEFGARIHITAAPDDRKAIAKYGECLLMGARPGAFTLTDLVQAMENVWTPEYEAFTEYLLENEVALLNDRIACVVAMLSNPKLGARV